MDQRTRLLLDVFGGSEAVRRAQRALSESDTRFGAPFVGAPGEGDKLYRAVLDALPALVCACDSSGTIVAVNQTWQDSAERNGLAIPDHGLGTNYLAECRRAATRDPTLGPILSGLEAVLRGDDDHLETEYSMGTLDGVERWYRVVVTPIALDGERGLVLAHVNVSDRHQLEAQLRHTQRMEVVGALAGGVAHDFNNALQAIQGFADLARTSVAGTETEVDLGFVLEATERARALVRQLQTLSRRGEDRHAEPVDLAELIRGFQKVLGHVVGPEARTEVRAPTSTPLVLADPGQLEQVVMNLCLNAREAMPSGGVVRIEVDEISALPRRRANGDDETPRPHVRVCVRDTGPGLDPEVREHMFDPLFTTKRGVGAAGLGLAVVWSVIKNHDGWIEVESEPGRGTTVAILLPVASASSSTGAEPEARGEHVATMEAAPPILLLAEDDPTVRRLATRILTGAGYELRIAADGDEALCFVDDPSVHLDLALLDAVMPGANGREVLERIRARRPGLGVVFMSGYSFDVLGESLHPYPDIPLVEKPFTADTLLAAVTTALAHGRAEVGD